jgi:hypothetical protein
MGLAVQQTTPDDPGRGWKIEFTPTAERWYMGLSQSDVQRMAAAFDGLEQQGPELRRPLAASIKSSRHHDMKELRSVGGNLRALVVCEHDRRRAVVLVGGDKTNDWTGWYERNIPLADNVYDNHLRKEGRWPRGAGERSGGRGR